MPMHIMKSGCWWTEITREAVFKMERYVCRYKNEQNINKINLVDTCNIALILFLKCDVTKFRIPPPLFKHTMTHFVNPLRLLNV